MDIELTDLAGPLAYEDRDVENVLPGDWVVLWVVTAPASTPAGSVVGTTGQGLMRVAANYSQSTDRRLIFEGGIWVQLAAESAVQVLQTDAAL
jgi:hypothetical protein